MPQLNPPDTGDPSDFQTDRLTDEQYGHMQRWNDDNYANDWAGPPPQAPWTPRRARAPQGRAHGCSRSCSAGCTARSAIHV